MVEIISKQECTGCSACLCACPRQCIVMKKDEEGFFYPAPDQETCIECGQCEIVCPVLHPEKEHFSESVFACKNRDDSVRKQSSSGGVFSMLAEAVLKENGVVFGACFDEKFHVEHRMAKTMDEVFAMQGAKYIQSRTDRIYRQVRVMLEDGKKVLFTGTPCQNAGLRHYLRREYEKLICFEVVCRGVANPAVYDAALDEIYGCRQEFESVSFRDKTYGWKRFSLRVGYRDHEYIRTRDKDPFLKGYEANLFLRPSCHNCGKNRMFGVSDITVGDYWGIEEKAPAFDDDKGVSLVIPNTEKGRELFFQCLDHMDFIESEFSHAKKANPWLEEISTAHPKREDIFHTLENSPEDIAGLILEITGDPASEKWKGKLHILLSKIKKTLKR